MTNAELKGLKATALTQLREYVPTVATQLADIDPRLLAYITDAIRPDMDTANIYELAGIWKFLRLLVSYDYAADIVRRNILAIEGRWDEAQHVCGGLKFDTPRGAQHVRLMPYQVYCIAGVYGHMIDQPLRQHTEGEMLLPTEFVGDDGRVYDTRRLIREADIFQTRKSGKTEFGAAAFDILDFLFGDSNGQVLICANSQAQAKICFRACKAFAQQLDPRGELFRITAEEINWLPGPHGRTSRILVLSAGGKTKDGLYGSTVHADEHGSAGYVKNHSDMQDLVEVCVGSMGPRREPLLVHTTTAGNVNDGPYQLQLRTVEEQLLEEFNTPLGTRLRTDRDRRFSFILRVDPWEVTDDITELNHDNIFRKVNRSIGVTVQPDYYRSRIIDAITHGADTKREVLTKDFNIWQTLTVRQWITADRVRSLQIDLSIDDINSDRYDPISNPLGGWEVYVGQDFSKGDDLCGQAYLCYRRATEEWFIDADCWVAECQLTEHTNAMLYQEWHSKNHLRTSPGRTIDEAIIRDRIIELSEHLYISAIGYDSYDSRRFKNAILGWWTSQGADPKRVRPVSQTKGGLNAACQSLQYMIDYRRPTTDDDGRQVMESVVHFGRTPVIPYCFGNAILVEDSYGNVSPEKATAVSGKIDLVMCILDGIVLQDADDAEQ